MGWIHCGCSLWRPGRLIHLRHIHPQASGVAVPAPACNTDRKHTEGSTAGLHGFRQGQPSQVSSADAHAYLQENDIHQHVQSLQVSTNAQQNDIDQHIQHLCEKGQLDLALNALSGALQLCKVPSPDAFIYFLKACSKRKALPLVRAVHTHLVLHGLEFTFAVSNHLVIAVATCGALKVACGIFNLLPCRTMFSWTAIISGCMESGQAETALELLHCMEKGGIKPDQCMYLCLFKACSSIADVSIGKKLHADVAAHGLASDVFIGSALVNLYGKCGRLMEAENVFDRLMDRDVVTWNSLLSGYVGQGLGETALKFYRQMQEEAINPTRQAFVMALQACGTLLEKEGAWAEDGGVVKVKALDIGKALHADVRKKGFGSDNFIGSILVSVYGKCGSIAEAETVFDSLSDHDIVLWNTMLSGYTVRCQGEKALQAYTHFQLKGVPPIAQTFVALLQACQTILDKEAVFVVQEIAQALHADIQRLGFTSNIFIRSAFLTLYGKCGSILEAENMFQETFQHDLVLWNAMLSAYLEQGLGEKTLLLYRQLQEEFVGLSSQTFVLVLQACGAEAIDIDMSLEVLQALHADARKRGFATNTFVLNTLVSMYGKCGFFKQAENLFEQLPNSIDVSWNVILSAYLEQGMGERALQIYQQMQEEGVIPNEQTFVMSIQACTNLLEKEQAFGQHGLSTNNMSFRLGEALHADALKKGLIGNNLVVATLMRLYAKCERLAEAENTFVDLSQHDIMLWNAMLLAYVDQGEGEKGLQLYRQMLDENVSLNEHTLVIAVQACLNIIEKEETILVDGRLIELMPLELAYALHSYAQMEGFTSCPSVVNSLVGLYGKCGKIGIAHDMFDWLSERDVISWNVILSAYLEQSQGEKVLQLFKVMQQEGVDTNEQTFVISIQACGSLSKSIVYSNGKMSKALPLEIVQALHSDVERKRFGASVFVCSALVNMYAKYGNIVEAEHVFGGSTERDIGLWNSMLSAYMEWSQAEKTLRLFRQMQEEGVDSNPQTFVIALQACGILVEKEECGVKAMSLEIGKALHADARCEDFISDSFLGNSLVSMYGKCGSIAEAENMFYGLSHPNLVSWNALLTAYVEHNQAEKALELYRRMEEECSSLSVVALICVLQACCEIGSVDICRELHFKTISLGYDLTALLASTLIHAYGSCASMVDAQMVFDGLPQPDIVAWNACIAGYAQEGNLTKGLHIFEEMHLSGIEPDGITFLSILTSCNHSGLVGVGLGYFACMSREYDIILDLKHYVVMVHLLGRPGYLQGVEDILCCMPMQPDLAIWMGILGVCSAHGNVQLGNQAFSQAVQLQPKEAAAYILMSNIYVNTGLQNCVVDLDQLSNFRHALL